MNTPAIGAKFKRKPPPDPGLRWPRPVYTVEAVEVNGTRVALTCEGGGGLDIPLATLYAKYEPLPEPQDADGAMLRLAVKHGIRIRFPWVESSDGHNAVTAGTFRTGEFQELFEDHPDPMAATRQAIQRAATAIEEAKQ